MQIGRIPFGKSKSSLEDWNANRTKIHAPEPVPPQVPRQPGDEYKRGQRDLCVHLIGIAQRTPGAEVWRALFAQILDGIE